MKAIVRSFNDEVQVVAKVDGTEFGNAYMIYRDADHSLALEARIEIAHQFAESFNNDLENYVQSRITDVF